MPSVPSRHWLPPQQARVGATAAAALGPAATRTASRQQAGSASSRTPGIVRQHSVKLNRGAAPGGKGRSARRPAPAASTPGSDARGLMGAYERALEVVRAAAKLPEVVVFDLDYCLWPFWCEMHSERDTPRLYPEARAVLQALRDSGVPLALASRTPTPHVARAFLTKLELFPFFASIQLIPAADGFDQATAQKDTAHFPALRAELGTAYERMLFFDDEHKNVQRVAQLGVTSVLVSTRTGVTVEVLQQGLQQYAAMAM